MFEIHRQTFTTSRKVIVAILVNVIDFFSWRTVFNFNFFEVKTSYHYAVDASKILLINSILSSTDPGTVLESVPGLAAVGSASVPYGCALWNVLLDTTAHRRT